MQLRLAMENSGKPALPINDHVTCQQPMERNNARKWRHTQQCRHHRETARSQSF